MIIRLLVLLSTVFMSLPSVGAAQTPSEREEAEILFAGFQYLKERLQVEGVSPTRVLVDPHVLDRQLVSGPKNQRRARVLASIIGVDESLSASVQTLLEALKCPQEGVGSCGLPFDAVMQFGELDLHGGMAKFLAKVTWHEPGSHDPTPMFVVSLTVNRSVGAWKVIDARVVARS
jgi:hypothetical protein